MTWSKGQSGNPGGRQSGTRVRITEAFLRDLEDAWRQHGPSAIKSMATDTPGDFVKVAANLLPRDVQIGAADSLVDMLKELNAIRTGAILGESGEESAGLRDGPVEGHA